MAVPEARGQRDRVGDRAMLADPAPRRPRRGPEPSWTRTAPRGGREGEVGLAEGRPRSQSPPGARSHRPPGPSKATAQSQVALGLANVIFPVWDSGARANE